MTRQKKKIRGQVRKSDRFSEKSQRRDKHLQEGQPDLDRRHTAGRNIGHAATSGEPRTRTAIDLKPLAYRLSALNDSQLAAIPIVAAGTELKQGAVYLDLRAPAPAPFTAKGTTTAGQWNAYTPKTEVPYETWHRLLDIFGPGKLRSKAGSAATNPPFSPQRATAEAAIERTRSISPNREPDTDLVDQTLAESFPASDPPSWTMGREKNSRRGEKGHGQATGARRKNK